MAHLPVVPQLVIWRQVTNMANPLAQLNAINEAASLLGIFNWQMTNATYENPNGTKVSFHVIGDNGIPLEQYISGAINAFNLVTGASATDGNLGLFNTALSSVGLRENIMRKAVVNRVPFANYDQLVDLGIGGQRLNFRVMFVGTMYQTALHNFVQCLFANDQAGLGVLTHPFYGKIKNVLPWELGTSYAPDNLNCVSIEVSFMTSDITHLDPANVTTTIVGDISKYYIGIQNSILSIGGTIAGAKALSNNFAAVL